MFEFGDELIIDSYRIPWLIWIQLVVMFLLVILLYYFSTTPSDLSLHFSTATSTASPSATGLSYNRSLITSAAANNHHNSKDRENEIKETETSTSELVQRTNKPNGRQREGSSTTTDEGDGLIFEHPHHPCHFFGLAKQAFLKCLGFDSSPENPTRRRHQKDD